MKAEVQLYATLRKFGPPQEGPFVVVLNDGERVAGLLEVLKIPPDVERVILLNGRPAEMDTVLNEGDRIVLFPPVAGG